MSLTIRDKSTVPSGGWRYPGLGGFIIIVRNFSLYYEEVVKHYTSNGVTPPTLEEVTRYACTELNIPCYEGTVAFANRLTAGLPSKFKGGCCTKKTEAA